ncbi:HIT-like domain-containing protein [Lipomyces arxii]|uniref:HIT-like domain-containing protein n=1 Tax=Lipomyces arxii TaxID=56418 RepID=UPI0034CE22D6
MSAIYFGPFAVTRQVFFQSSHSYALVNLKPILPGHVLICPYRVVPRIKDLSTEEVADLFVTVQKVSKVIENVYKADSLNIAVQDGPLAGQSVPHVHCHIIPRKLSDLPNVDDVYALLNSKDADLELSFQQLKSLNTGMANPDDEDRKPRTEQEMWKEAEFLAKKMAKSSL